jgi:hypothetical protein
MTMLAQDGHAGETVTGPPNTVLIPATDREREEVRSQLQKILSSSVFQNSKRYAAVLKYIVDQTLEGAGDRLKERTIGIEVFQRAPDYDTSTDHAVRSAVAEVRKRLAQYYQQAPRDRLRIEVQPGSYMPQFRRAEEALPLAAPAAHPGPATAEGAASGQVAPASEALHRRPGFAWLAVASVAAIGVAALIWFFARPSDTYDKFWNPILSSHSPVLLCIGNVEGGRRPLEETPILNPTMPLSDFHNSPAETVNVYDAFTMARFAGLIAASGRQFQFASQSDATFTDLQNGPTILVGLLNNNWTVRLVSRLRFYVEQPTPNQVSIRDRNSPQNHEWAIDYGTPYLDVTRDYALVLRMVDPKTEQMVVVAAGITVFGTTAAADFLTNRKEMKKLAAIAPPGWENKNMEIVLSTDVISGRSGPATVVAAQFW